MNDNSEQSDDVSPIVTGPGPTLSIPIDAPEHVGVPARVIDWNRSTPWWKPLLTTLPISWRLTHLLLCAVGLILTDCYLWLVGKPFGVLGTFPYSNSISSDLVGDLLPSTNGAQLTSFVEVWGRFVTPALLWMWGELDLPSIAYSLAAFLGILAIWSFIGGCLMRRTVIEIGTGTSPLWKESIQLVAKRWQSMVWSLLMPASAIFMLCIGLLLLGFISNIPIVGDWIVVAIIPLLAILVLAIGWAGAITLFGFPLSIAAIVTEKQSDAFDGLSRSSAYVFQRPVLVLLFGAIFELISRFGGMLFATVLQGGGQIAKRAFDLGAFSKASEVVTIPEWAFSTIGFYLLASFGVSYFWAAQSMLYLLLRKSVDSAEFHAVE